MPVCTVCSCARGIIKRPKTGEAICKDCFFQVFENEVHQTITDSAIFKPGQKVAIGASGGKGKLFVFSRLYFCQIQLFLLTYSSS